MPHRVIKNSIFLDEIQNFPLWEKWLKGIYDKRKDIKFVISGSNASLLSEEISSRLTGRHITTRMFPFSFFEFLKYKNISFNLKTIAYSDKKIEIKRKMITTRKMIVEIYVGESINTVPA